MSTATPRTRRVVTALATPAAILAGATLVWQASYAAFSGTTRSSGNSWSTGSVALTDDDAGSARFQATNLTPDDTETRCIKVTAAASARCRQGVRRQPGRLGAGPGGPHPGLGA